MSFTCGLVGLPNIGKSTLFNALTSSKYANTNNYPFCTIEPNYCLVSVPDTRLQKLSFIERSIKTVYAKIEFIDIAGIVKGAHNGEGLGNKFLSNIRNVDSIAYIVRCFQNNNIIHTEGSVNSIRDTEIIEMELILADIQSLNKQLNAIKKKTNKCSKISKKILLINAVLKTLNLGNFAKNIINKENQIIIESFNLLTSKPFFYICNIGEDNITYSNKFSKLIKRKAIYQNTFSVNISAKIEEEISNLKCNNEKNNFLKELNIYESGFNKVFQSSCKILNLCTYYTTGKKESRAWILKNNTVAQEAAKLIHEDFKIGFICAEIIRYKDFINHKGDVGSRNSGKLRKEGKNYIISDGDIVLFRFNVSKTKKKI